MRLKVAIDPHLQGGCRSIAPLQREAGFFEAFGIKLGDPLWRAESERVTIW